MSESLGRGSDHVGKNRALDSPPRTCIPTRFLGPDLKASGWETDQRQLEGIFFYIPNEAHNGYLETYLTLGLVGCSSDCVVCCDILENTPRAFSEF